MIADKTQTAHVRPERPGAMTTAMRAVTLKPSGPKVLRIGVVRDENIVDDRILRGRESVTVGNSEKNHFVVNDAALPARFELFQGVGDDYVLNFTEQMQGRVGQPGGVQDLAQLRASGKARNAGMHFQIKLNDNSRGKIVVGGTTLLFQFVPSPTSTHRARPQIPAAVRGGLARSIDWTFTAFTTFSFMSAFGFIVYLENYDGPIDRGIAAIPDAIAEIIFADPPPPDEVIPPPSIEPNDANDDMRADANDDPTPHTDPKRVTPSPNRADDRAPDDADAVARLTKEAAQQAESLIVGALSADANGVFAEVLAAGAVTGKAEDILAQVDGVGIAQSASGGELRSHNVGGNGSGGTEGLGALASISGNATQQRDEQRTVVERLIRGETKLAQGGGDIGGTGDFDPATVVSMIKLRMGAIKACYERSLRTNPSLAGKVTVEFTIVPAGTVSASRIAGNTTGDAAVAQCVVTTIDTLRFKPGPQGGSVVYSYPFIFSPMN